MSSDWPLVRIDDIKAQRPGSIAIGPFGSRMKSECYVSRGVSVVRGMNLTGERSFAGDFVFITQEKADELNSANLQPNDLVFPHRGAIGEVGVTPNDGKRYVLSSSLMKLTCATDIAVPDFLYYFFKSDAGRFELLKNASQVGTPGIGQPLSSLRNVLLRLPSVAEQRTIAMMLRSLDDRVDLLRASKTTLEAIAQSLFKSWFVDFDPVRAKQRAAVPAAVDEATAALFPAEFTESRLGQIPAGWRLQKLKDVTVYLSRGISPKYVDQGGVLVINQKCIRNGAVDVSKARRHDDQQRSIDGRELQVGDVLINSTGVGTLGRVAQLLVLGEPAVVDSHVTVLRASDELSWVFLGLEMGRRQGEIESLGEGTTGQTELSRGKLGSLDVLVPPKRIVDAFKFAVEPLRRRGAQILQQAETLIALRDTLLPRLISGQLRIPEVEASIAAAIA